MTLHPPRSAPPTPVRLRLYAWAAGLFLGALEGALAVVVADIRSGALALVCVVGVAMVLGTVYVMGGIVCRCLFRCGIS